MSKDRFLSFVKNLSNKCGKQLLDTATKTKLDAAKTASKEVLHETAEASSNLINKINEKMLKPKPGPDENSRNGEEIVIPPQKKKINIE